MNSLIRIGIVRSTILRSTHLVVAPMTTTTSMRSMSLYKDISKKVGSTRVIDPFFFLNLRKVSFFAKLKSNNVRAIIINRKK